MQTTNEIAESLRQASQRVAAAATSYEYPEADVEELMDLLYEIGRRSQIDPEFSRAVAETGVIAAIGEELRGSHESLERYADDLYAMLEDYWDAYFALDDWRKACIRRSALAFACELLASTAYNDLLHQLPLAEVDESLKNSGKADLAGGIPFDEIPEGIPQTHWWWWAPMLGSGK